MKGEMIMNTGNVLIPVKDFMSLDPFRLFPNRMEHLFEEPMLRTMMGNQEWPLKAWVPPCDIFETEKELVMKFELPEVKKEDVEVNSSRTCSPCVANASLKRKNGPRKLSSRRAALW